MQSSTELFVAGRWRSGADTESTAVYNPATGERIGAIAHASDADLDEAVAGAVGAFRVWKEVSAFDRYQVMSKAADLIATRAERIARSITVEQGKPFAEALGEAQRGAEAIRWFAEEARRQYGRTVSSRSSDTEQIVVREPVGPVAAFTPWNFPLNQAIRKVSAALAAGCSIVLKGPENTPTSCVELVRAFEDAGVPAGTVNLVFGVPGHVSGRLIKHPDVRKVSFTGSTAVGKQLASLAGQHMKRITMELGGHSPVLVFEDADVDEAVRILADTKFRNAGQVCTSPTRFLIQRGVYQEFAEKFAEAVRGVTVGDGSDPATRMGPLAHDRRVSAMCRLVEDAVLQGATRLTEERDTSDKGYFFRPTVLADLPLTAAIMNEEPFGPVVPLRPFDGIDDALEEANRLPYGLAAYVFTRSAATIHETGKGIESGMVSFNQTGLGGIEMPFGGIKDSGFGSEGGVEAIDSYVNIKTLCRRFVR